MSRIEDGIETNTVSYGQYLNGWPIFPTRLAFFLEKRPVRKSSPCI